MAETGRLLQAARPPVGLSPATARTYAASWRAFVGTQAADRCFPVGPVAVAAWLEARAKGGRPRQSLVVDRAALTAWCAANGEGLDVALPATRVRRTGVDAASLLAAARRCGPDLPGLRDRALLLLAATLDIGAEALARLTVEDITDMTDGMTVALLRPRSGRHQLRRLRRRRDPAVCPVRNWAAWRDAAQLRWGQGSGGSMRTARSGIHCRCRGSGLCWTGRWGVRIVQPTGHGGQNPAPRQSPQSGRQRVNACGDRPRTGSRRRSR